MNPAISEHIENLVKRITSTTSATTIFLFGSQANGTATEESDIDLCVLTKDNKKRKIEILREIRKAIAPIVLFPVDILIYQENEFEDRASLPSTLEYKIRQGGIKVYGH